MRDDYLIAENLGYIQAESGDLIVLEDYLIVQDNYDLPGALSILFPGVVAQRPLIDAAYDRYLAKGAPLDSSDVTAILAAANVLNAATAEASYVPTTQPNYPAALPAYPTGLPRFPEAYGGMESTDGWTIVTDNQVVNP